MRTAEDIVRQEVHYCVSHLVATLAGGYGDIAHERTDLATLTYQAMELASPIDDWEEAARQEGFKAAGSGPYVVGPDGEFVSDDIGTLDPTTDDCWRLVCEQFDIDPYEREVFEHWIVSDWLAEKLAAHGEKVDTDFAGMTVWARTTTGQAIAVDHVIKQIAAEL